MPDHHIAFRGPLETHIKGLCHCLSLARYSGFPPVSSDRRHRAVETRWEKSFFRVLICTTARGGHCWDVLRHARYAYPVARPKLQSAMQGNPAGAAYACAVGRQRPGLLKCDEEADGGTAAGPVDSMDAVRHASSERDNWGCALMDSSSMIAANLFREDSCDGELFRRRRILRKS